MLAFVPWVVADAGGIFLLGRGVAVTGSPPMMISLVMGGVLQTVVLSLSAVIASLVFVALAAQVRRAGA